MVKNIIYILLFKVFFVLVSCHKYLDTWADSSFNVLIDNEEKIAELLTGAYPRVSYFSFLEARTDNVEERPNGIHTRLNEAMYFWEDFHQEDLDTPLNYWNACYTGIAQANKALELLATYPKTKRVKALYAEAFLLRSYLHFMLVNIWAEPYDGNTAASLLGIPYLERPEKNALVNYPRLSLLEVYEKIERDLKLGITLVDDSFYQKPKFHFNKAAAYAFASRFYLMKADWEKVIAYSDYVLSLNKYQGLRPWHQDRWGNKQELYQTYTNSSAPYNLLLATTESRLYRELPLQKYGLSLSLAQRIFNEKIEGCHSPQNFIQSYPLYNSQVPVVGAYVPKFDEFSLFGNTGANSKGVYVTNVLFSTDEVALNRLEAYAMTNQYDKWVQAFKEYRKEKYGVTNSECDDFYTIASSNNYATYTPFYGLTVKQLALVKIVAEFRRREFLHEGLRWLDIRRFHLSIQRNTTNAIYQPLTKNDPRKVLQIPLSAIELGMKPNER